MNIRHFFISLLFPVMVMCTPVQPQDQSNENNNQGNNPEIIDADAAVAPEVKDGDRILVTNEIVQKFLSEITYPERDYTYSAMKKGEEVDFLKYQYVDEDDGETKTRLYISPGQCDIPPKYTVRWPKDTKSDKYTGKLWEGDWSAEYDLTPDPDSEVSFGYWEIRNLRPNAHYNFEVKNGSETVTSGQFDTYGLLHQLIFKPGSGSGVRNVRDLGGWKTKDGSKTVKYRKIYRGGRPEAINKAGVQEAKAEEIISAQNWTSVAGAMRRIPMDHIKRMIMATKSKRTTTSFLRVLLKAPYSLLLKLTKDMPRCSATTKRRPGWSCSSSWIV